MLSDYVSKMRTLLEDDAITPVCSAAIQDGTSSIAADTYYLKVTFLTDYGESLPSAAATAVVDGDDQQIAVTIERVGCARGYRVYASDDGTHYYYQSYCDASQESTIEVALTNLTLSGTAAPTADTASRYLSPGQYLECLDLALTEYSRSTPYVDVETYTPDEGELLGQQLDLPEDWDADLSFIINLEYPISRTPPEYLVEGTDYEVRSGVLYLTSFAPGADESVKLHYARAHDVDDDETDTVPSLCQQGVALLAASKACRIIGTRYAHQSNTAIAADRIDYVKRSADFRQLGMDYEKMAWDALGRQASARAYATRASWDYYRDHNRFR